MRFKKVLCALSAAAVLGSAPLPFGGSFAEGFSIVASAASKLAAPANVKAAVDQSKVTLEWDAVEGADRYMVYAYNGKTKKFEELKRVKSCTAVFSGLKPGSYIFKVAAGVKSGKDYKFGKLSKQVKVKIKELTAIELAKAMGNGWNLGNTMEATGDWVNGKTVWDFEKCWGAPKTTFEMMKGVKEAGFDTVRVPVAWSNLMSKDGKYTISKELFDRVDEIVGYVLDNDMYCILNIHWDGGWWEGLYSKDEKVSAETMKRYETMWKQIAKHYANYSDKLIFESANEELGKDPNNKLPKNSTFAIVNKANQTFVDIVRSSGGNNAKRYLLIAGYNTNIDDTINDKFEMPKDTIKNHLLISVHYYNPATYCIAEKSNNSWGYKGEWGSKSDIEEMDRVLAKMKKFTDAGYGVIIGEYGVARCTDGGKKTIKSGSADFYKNVVRISQKYGYCPVLWDTPVDYWFSRQKLEFVSEDVAAVYARKG